MLSFLAAFLLQPPALIDQIHCTGTGQAARDLHPIGSGPLRLATVYCHQEDAVRHGFFDPFISPDGQQVASLSEFQPRGRLTLLPLSSRTATANVETNAGTFMRFSVPGGRPFVQWSDDSRFVWAARHRGEPAPGGWVTSPLQPIRVFPDGRVASLPSLDHAAGSLDGLLWAGGNGLALAKFGTQGGFYRPERPNPAPTMAIVDAARGRVLQSVLLEQLLSLAGRPVTSISYASVRSAYAVQLPNGRVRALLDVRDNWVLWDQGRAPRLVRNLQAASRWGSHAFDGRRLLVMRPGVAFAAACGGYHGACPPRAPRKGIWAELYDVDSGRLLWSLERDFDVRDSYATPTISPDGRYALITLEPANSAARLALVSMRDGTVIQMLPAPPGSVSAGFTRGGSALWVQSQGRIAIYRVTRSQ